MSEGRNLDLIPTPQHVERLGLTVDLARGARIVLAPNAAPQTLLAGDFFERELRRPEADAVTIRLAEWPEADAGDLALNALDEQVLSARHHGQGYVLRTADERTVLLVGPPLGLLYGAMTLLQLAAAAGKAGRLPGIYIRDFPSFRYRAASCWLLNGEGNRWSLDRGQGQEAYEELCRRKLDFCLRFKINMVLFDGFGFGLAQRSAEYPAMMRRLNAYARQRGIHLVHGGYGAGYGMAYQPGPLYEEAAYLGTVWMNRRSYPDGPAYACLGYPRTRAGRDPAHFGTCRSNDALNRLKTEELAAYVRAVEPGALYIHYEDFGGYDTTQRYWLKRCGQCRQRWPSDRTFDADGAAGAIAHGYSTLIQVVNAVRNPDSGYDAARDCVIILTSPVYVPSSPSSGDWSNALRLWQNIARGLPAAENLVACFRETFPQQADGGRPGTRWVDVFNQAMADAGRPLGLWVFFAGGADHWLNDCPFVGTPAMNILFEGAEGIYSASGDAYQEPQQVLNAEYAWSVRSNGFWIEERSWDAAHATWLGLAFADLKPPELFGPEGWLPRICRRLYGPAAAYLVRHFTECESLRPPESRPTEHSADAVAGPGERRPYLPLAYAKIFGVPAHWRRLALDSKTWPDEISNEVHAQKLAECGISRAELHTRLRRQWELVRRASQRSAHLIEQAIAAGVPAPSRDDLEFCRRSLEVTLLLCQTLEQFHEARRLHFGGAASHGASAECLQRAALLAEQATALAQEYFPHPLDPSGGEVGYLRAKLAELRAAIRRDLVPGNGPPRHGP